jgi:protease-4
MSLLTERLRRATRRLALSWTLFVIVGVVVGLVAAPYAFSMAAEPSGTVAVVPVEGGIDGSTAAGTAAMLQQARADASIEAVVLLANSPGGGASASESMYLDVKRTADRMPVVASVDAMAASGAYYTIAPSDKVFTKPSSLVGSVGVYTSTPQDPQPIDEVVATGPDKLSGGDRRDWEHKTESLRRALVGAVFDSRGEQLTISRSELSEAGIFTGSQAVTKGMADEIGGLQAAIRDAADRAGLDSYDVEVLRPGGDGGADSSVKFISRANFVASDAPNKELVAPEYFVGELGEDPAVPNIVMLPASVLAATVDDPEVAGNATTTPTGGSGGGDAEGDDANASVPTAPAAVGLPEVTA